MVFDACDALTFTGVANTVTNVSADKTSATFKQTAYSDPLEIKRGGTGLTNPAHVVVRCGAASTSGSNTVQFNVQTSTDGANWFDRTSGDKDKIALTNTASKPGVINLPLVTTDPFVRLAVVITGGGSGSVVPVLSADLNISPL